MRNDEQAGRPRAQASRLATPGPIAAWAVRAPWRWPEISSIARAAPQKPRPAAAPAANATDSVVFVTHAEREVMTNENRTTPAIWCAAGLPAGSRLRSSAQNQVI